LSYIFSGLEQTLFIQLSRVGPHSYHYSINIPVPEQEQEQEQEQGFLFGESCRT
jgi:hypothetical protein